MTPARPNSGVLERPEANLDSSALGGAARVPGNRFAEDFPWRRLALPKRIENWSLTSLQQRLVKTGGRLVKHARYYWLLLAESHLTRRLFGNMVRRIAVLSLPAG
jgi:hypothetical protein